jgi:BirA family biotin operon repressor/biotin-[acetyl-CoA-carboxylase] ligase
LEDLLSYLNPGSWVSGEEIAARLGITRAAVWKQVQSLRALGYEIEASTNRGYRLACSPDILDKGRIRPKTKILGKDLRCYLEVPSTNEAAKEIARGCQDGTVILAEVQTEGRGRLNRSWLSPPGGVWMSLILKPELPVAHAYRINMAVGVAIARTISCLYGLRAGIKWPNDILVNERKLSGILTEISAEMDRIEYAVVGVGVNANVDVDDFPEEWRATSLSRELGFPVSRVELVQRLLEEVEEAYTRIGSPEIYREWRDLSATLGRRVRVASHEGEFEGQAVSLSEDGALSLSTSSGIRRVLAGDCIHLRAL